jgi:hypothetical protein
MLWTLSTIVSDWLFTVLRHALEFFTYVETSTLPVKGCKILAYAQCSGPLSRGDLYRATPTVTQGLGFPGLIQRTASFSHLLRHAWGCGGSILIRYWRRDPASAMCAKWWQYLKRRREIWSILSHKPANNRNSTGNTCIYFRCLQNFPFFFFIILIKSYRTRATNLMWLDRL